MVGGGCGCVVGEGKEMLDVTAVCVGSGGETGRGSG